MKRLVLLILGLGLLSCSNNDDDSASGEDFYPEAVGNYWIYEVEALQSGIDSLYFSGSRELDGSTYSVFGAREPVFGLYTLLVRDNYLRSDNGRIYVRGVLSGFGDAFPELSVNLEDLLIFDPSKEGGYLLDTQDQEISIPYDQATLTGRTTVQTEMLETGTTLEVNGVVYTNVRASVMIVTATAAVSGELDGIPVTIPVLGEQEILRMELYFAEGTGLIYSDAVLQYELSNTEFIENPIGESYLEEIRQSLLRSGTSGGD